MIEKLQAGDPPRIGLYQLLARLGAGGMGRVFLGRSAGGRLVAVKVIRPELAQDSDFRARFAHEVAAARKVSALFTAAVLDADVDGPVPWLATAYVPGPSLLEAVSAHGALPAPSVAALAAGLAEGLHAIHQAGVVHRDLKPSNVLLAADGPRVIDFGISRAVEATSLTRTGMLIGSPGFMSPEQAEGGEVGPPSDVFSLGAVLVFAATGAGPFGFGATPALVYRVVHADPDFSGLEPELRALIGPCLEKDPRRRPTAGELLDRIRTSAPGPDWLPAALASALAEYAQVNLAAPGQGQAPPGQAWPPGAANPVTSPQGPGAGGGPPPRRRRRSPALWIAAGLVLAAAAGGLASTHILDRLDARSANAVAAATRSGSPTQSAASPPAAAGPSASPSPSPSPSPTPRSTPSSSGAAPSPSSNPPATPTPSPPSPTPTPSTVSVTVTVQASGGWADTGIRLRSGEAVTINAVGSWTADGTTYTGPNGYTKQWPDNFFDVQDLGSCAYCASTPTPYWGALISYTGYSPPAVGSYTSLSVAPQTGKIGLVGSHLSGSSPLSGELWLAFNDDAYSANTSDNYGKVTATVTVPR